MQRRALIAVVVIALVAAGAVAAWLFQRPSLTPEAGKRITLDAPAQPDMTEPADQPDPATPQQTEATQPGATAEPESEPAKPRSGERQSAEPADSAETPRTVASEGAPDTEGEPSRESQIAAEAETDRGPTADGEPSPAERAAVEPEGGDDAAEPEAADSAPADTGETADAAAGETASAAVPPVRPSFDIVRVERSGEAVIAGRAAPDSQITVFEGEEPIGSVRADKRGEWVLVPDRPLRPGDRQLTLEAVSPDGKAVASEEVVVVSLPGGQSRPAPATTDAGDGEGAADVPGEATARREAGSEQVARAPEATVATEAAETGQAAGEDEEEPEAPVEPAAIGDHAPEAQPEAPLAVVTTRSGKGPVRVLQSPESPAALKAGELVLLAVNYTGDGRITVSGRAPADARLLLYLNNDLVAHTRADAENRWRMSPERDVPPGLHVLRVDQVDESGRVIARVETPFSRSAMVGSLDTGGFVIVQPGNNLWRIARRTYGRGWQYTVIYEANEDQIRDPDLIYPGQVFVLPETE